MIGKLRPATHLRRRIARVGILLVGFNLLAWACALAALHRHPLLIGTALLAYGLGLRHAVDADHIAAIDNVMRKLMQEGQRPVGVGLFFSLGHSTVVAALCLLVAETASALQDRFAGLRSTGEIAGTCISALFLLAIATVNAAILTGSWRRFRELKRGRPAARNGEDPLSGGGLMARLFGGLFRLIGRSWHMYLLGLLFGLGFDTATEVGLLAVSARGASSGASPWAIMALPILFSAGMALVDTADGVLMLGAYGWAFIRPIRKLYYNLTITILSVLVATAVGGIETLGLVRHRLGLVSPFWRTIGTLNDDFGLLGYAVIGLFVLGWCVSFALYRARRYDDIDATTL